MSAHIRNDFTAHAPISQVPASWFNAVANFINGLIPGDNCKFEKHVDGSPTVIDVSIESEMGTPTDNTTASIECPSGETPEASTLTFTGWDAGGANGLKIRLYGLVDGSTLNEHIFFPVDLDIASNGMVKSVKAPTGAHGVWVGA